MKTKFNLTLFSFFFFCSLLLSGQNKTSFYVSAHPDDWQLFMNPNVYQSVKENNKKVVILHTTAGDAGYGTGNNNYMLAREEGSLRALRFMSNTFTSTALGSDMNETVVTINGHDIVKFTYRNIVAYFLRLPDGNLDGGGFPLHNFKSLQKLFNNNISNISAVDNSTTYTSLTDLEDTLRLIVETESADLNRVDFNLPDHDDSINPDDHSDHIYSSEIMQNVANDLGNITIKLYVDYDTESRAQNVFNHDFLVSAGTWGVTTSGLSDHHHYSTWDESHNAWIGKQYFRTLNGIPTISLENSQVIVDENTSSGFARFTVALNGDINENVAVDYTTNDGTALSSSDYTLTSGSIVFTPTNKSFNIDIPIIDDEDIEQQEEFTLVLSNIASNLEVNFTNNALFLVGDAIINDNDDSSLVNIALNKPTTASSSEDSQFSSLAVDNDFSLDSWWGANPYAQWWQVDLLDEYDISQLKVTNYYDGTRYYQYDIQGSLDGVNWTNIVDFNSNTTPATNQGNTFNVSNTTARYLRVNMNFNSANVGVHIIEFEAYGDLAGSNNNNTEIAFTNSNITVDENISSGFARFNVTLNGNISENVTIDYTTSNGSATSPSDYSITNGTITFTPTNKSFYIDVPIIDDLDIETQESFNVVLSNIVTTNTQVSFVGGNSTLSANGTIVDNDDNTPINVALNKPTTASSFEDDRYSALAVDNDFSLDSWWGANPYAQWWQVDLLAAYDINQLRVVNYYGGSRYYQYDIQGSLDGVNWTNIIDFNSNTTSATSQGNTFNISSTSMRYIRVNMNFNSANVGVHIVEFQAYGIPSSTAKTSSTKKVSEESIESEKSLTTVNLYPNPIKKGEDIIIQLDNSYGEIESLEVYNLRGVSLLRSKIEKKSNKIKLNSNALMRGLYIVNLTLKNGETINKRIIIK